MNKKTTGLPNRKSWPVWTAALTLAISASLAPPQTIQSADITVDAAGDCTLEDAIISANTNRATNNCLEGDPDPAISDIIILETNVTGTPPVSGAPPVTAAFPVISSLITIEGSDHTIDGNGVGPVLFNDDNLTLNDVIVTGGNNTSGSGGGIVNTFNGTLVLNNCVITNNSTQHMGGGIYNDGTLTLYNCTVSGNTATKYGGGIYNEGSLTLTSSTISGNNAYWGGGIDNYGELTVNNSTISGNTASGVGGGIDSYGGTTTVKNSTISGNATITGFGGGIYSSKYATISLTRSLVSGNTSPSGAEIQSYYSSPAIDDAYNVFGHQGLDNSSAFVNFTPGSSDVTATSDGSNPTELFAILDQSLANNGGSTWTHALVPGSPAIDLAPDCGTPPLVTDQRGYTRPVGQGCDAGAYEFAPNNNGFLPAINMMLLLKSTPPTTN